VQTFVFSATLTLPPALRRRVRRGGGGASGSASLDALMASLAFRDKPLVADLTSARRLADRARPASCSRSRRPVLAGADVPRTKKRTPAYRVRVRPCQPRRR